MNKTIKTSMKYLIDKDFLQQGSMRSECDTMMINLDMIELSTRF